MTFTKLLSSFLDEYPRWVLWLPVFQAAGIATYFELAAEPSGKQAVLGLALSMAGIVWQWRKPILRAAFLILLFFAIGFASAKLRSELVFAPKIAEETFVTLSGNVEEISYNETTPRLLLNNLRIDDFPRDKIPAKVRVTVRTKIKGELAPGDRVITDAILLPPPEPVFPNAYDFSRWAYFKQIGATGYAVKSVVKLKEGHQNTWLNKLRFDITQFILASTSGQAGAITAALVTGERSGISEETNQAMRASGLAHILSISGLHLSLVAGFFFVLVRYGLGFVSFASTRINTKKLAAGIAILGSFFYLLISGMPTPAIRSFVMIFLLLLAVLLDRSPSPMRSVAFAAFVILLVMPESILDAGFQMSFIAVFALVAVYDLTSKRWRNFFAYEGESKARKNFGKIAAYPVGIALTSIFAGLATTPFAAYHFNQYAAYGLVANLLAMPLSSFWIMPMAVFAAILAPIGLADECFAIMAQGVDAMIAVANYVSSLQGAAGVWKSFDYASLAVIAFGMLWLFIWQKNWRFFGLVPICLGVLMAMQTPLPIAIVAGNGKLWAVEIDGELHLSSTRKTFSSEQWVRSFGQSQFLRLPKQDVYEVGGKTVSFNCSEAELMIETSKTPCPQAHITLDMLAKNGTHAVYIDGGNILIENVGQQRGARLWTK